jgi:bacillithiol biosynthesis cysteine-adding enzyme BshC
VKAQCLPFNQVPHTTKLFSDFLSYDPKVRPFYPHSPFLSEWSNTRVAELNYDQARRQRVANVLQSQNQAWGASPQTLSAIERLRSGASAIVTGQQAGLFGGPLFAVLKALSAIRLAAQVRASGKDFVPIFWIATEDHDFAEINHTTLLDSTYRLRAINVDPQHIEDAPVGTIRLGQEIAAAVDEVAGLLGETDIVAALRESYRPEETLGTAFARLFTRIFADFGLIVLDPSDPELHAIAEPILRAAIERAAELDTALMARGKELEQAGYHQQVKVTAATSLLFKVQNGVRHAIRRKSNGPDEYIAGIERLSQRDLLAQISATPELFNANVLLRPVVQDYLLPTVAYIGGAAEVAYFAQAAVVYEKLLGKVTPIISRFSATLVEPKPESLLQRYGLNLPDLFHGPEAVSEKIAAKTLPGDVQSSFTAAREKIETQWTGLRDSLAQLDPTLVEASERAKSKVLYQVQRLGSRAARAQLRRAEVLSRHAQVLSNGLFPHKMLQERQLPGIYFLARYGNDLLKNLYDTIQPDCLDHQIVSSL